MTIRVVSPPEPIVSPADLGEVSASPFAEPVIASVTAEFDGPLGTLGRCFGVQTLDYILQCAPRGRIALPCGPVIDVVEAVRLSGDGDQAFMESEYHLAVEDLSLCSVFAGRIRIRYRAGYDGTTTGVMPPQIRQAIILKSRLLLTMLDKSAFVRSSEVEGVGRWEYSVPEQVSLVIDKAVESLVAGLKVYRL